MGEDNEINCGLRPSDCYLLRRLPRRHSHAGRQCFGRSHSRRPARRHLAVLDDDSSVKFSSSEMVSRLFKRVHIAGKSGHPCRDILLLDIHLPRVDGFRSCELFARMKTNCTQTPVLVLSASITPSDRLWAESFEHVHFVQKPVTLDCCNLTIGRQRLHAGLEVAVRFE